MTHYYIPVKNGQLCLICGTKRTPKSRIRRPKQNQRRIYIKEEEEKTNNIK